MKKIRLPISLGSLYLSSFVPNDSAHRFNLESDSLLRPISEFFFVLLLSLDSSPCALSIPPLEICKYVKQDRKQRCHKMLQELAGLGSPCEGKALFKEHKVRSSCVGMADRREWFVRRLRMRNLADFSAYTYFGRTRGAFFERDSSFVCEIGLAKDT